MTHSVVAGVGAAQATAGAVTTAGLANAACGGDFCQSEVEEVNKLCGGDYCGGEAQSLLQAANNACGGDLCKSEVEEACGGSCADETQSVTQAIQSTTQQSIQQSQTPLLENVRTHLLRDASNSKLVNLINQLYRATAKIGDGGTADALKYELQTGSAKHLIKAMEMRTALLRLWNSGTLNSTDAEITRRLLINLQNALSGK